MTKNATEDQISGLALVGCGNMGSALLSNWLTYDTAQNYLVVDHKPLAPAFRQEENLQHCTTLTSEIFVQKPDAIILAVKPKDIDGICALLGTIYSDAENPPLVISIAAGRTLEVMQGLLTPFTPLVRTMPNTPAAIGKGVIAAIANDRCNKEHLNLTKKIFESAGPLFWLEDESLIDAVTALAGSGPAYVFYLIEVLEKSGKKLGLPKNIAAQMARQTVIGSAALSAHEKDVAANTLRQNVTSPGGTTEAALSVLMDGTMQRIFDQALTKAVQRAQELSGQ